jgi:hypothetical protein
MSDLERALKEVRRRDWDKMRSSWLDRIALVEGLTGEPELALSGVTELPSIASDFIRERRNVERTFRETVEERICALRAKRSGTREENLQKELEERKRFEQETARRLFAGLGTKRFDLPAVPVALFQEGLRLAHKALHVLGCAETHADRGLRSWSLCSAYQASLFAGKSLLAFCGLGLAEISSKTLVVDVFPGPVERSTDYTDISIGFVAYRLDHKDVWEVIQRLLGVTVCEVWPKDAVDKLKTIEEKRFAKQRNDIHYKNQYWPLPDLYDFDTTDPFGIIKYWHVSSGDLDFDRPDISLVISYYFVRMTLALIQDLGRLSAKLRAEVDLFEKCIVAARHPYYHESLSIA